MVVILCGERFLKKKSVSLVLSLAKRDDERNMQKNEEKTIYFYYISLYVYYIQNKNILHHHFVVLNQLFVLFCIFFFITSSSDQILLSYIYISGFNMSFLNFLFILKETIAVFCCMCQKKNNKCYSKIQQVK